MTEGRKSQGEWQIREFNRRRNLVGTEVRYVHGGARSMTMVLSNRGTELGERTTITKRGKIIQTLYVLPDIAAWELRFFPP